jgi:DNA-binding NtrC family response regulator
VLLVGEAGTGKAFLARFIHQHGPRQAGPFVATHCSHLPANTAESALFGHEKGAFSGATSRRAGLVEQADGGTLLIDGLSDLAPALQTKLLRMVQEGRFYRVGGTRPVRVDVRVIAGTSRDLRELAAGGAFRGDLLARIDVLRIGVPPLRQRIADIAPLVDRFVDRFNMRNGIRHKGFSAEAAGLLEGHGWPGNVGQLRDAMERLLIRSAGEYVQADEVDEELVAMTATETGDDDLAPEVLAALDRRLLARALSRCRGNKGRTSLMMRTTRGQLDRMIAMHDLDLYGR